VKPAAVVVQSAGVAEMDSEVPVMAATHRKNLTFPSTMWTDMAHWKAASDGEKRVVLDRFYSRYRIPLIRFIQSRGYDASDAEDLLHDFVIEHKAGRLFLAADRSRGRFRNLLLTSLKNFLVSRKRTAGADKRSPRSGFLSMEQDTLIGVRVEELIPDNRTPEEIYERAWLLTLLLNAVSRLREDYERKNQHTHFILFEKRVILPILQGSEKPGLAGIAAELGLDPAEASNLLVTAKRGYQRHLREEIREYAASEKEVAEEIHDFFHFLQALRP
jgi:DNA-directed RNA polymerase specialized sigma24 family protein